MTSSSQVATSEADHLSTLDKLFTHLVAACLHLKRSKYAFLLLFVEYLGHKMSVDGLQPTEEKLELCMYLGRSTFDKGITITFLPGIDKLANTLAPLYNLYRKPNKLLQVLWHSFVHPGAKRE